MILEHTKSLSQRSQLPTYATSSSPFVMESSQNSNRLKLYPWLQGSADQGSGEGLSETKGDRGQD